MRNSVPLTTSWSRQAEEAPARHNDGVMRIYISRQLQNPEFSSDARRAGIARLGALATVEDLPADLSAADAAGAVAVIADGTFFPDDFYAAADHLRVVARWGVGFDQVNLASATRYGVLVTVTPVHMETVAEYTIAQWMATMKRTYTFNRMAHAGDWRVIRCFDVQGSCLGLYGFGRIGQEVAKRAVPLLGERGRLLVYDIRDDVVELAARFGAEVVAEPEELFRRCDTVCVHVSGADPVVGYEQLALMRPHASVINPSRGTLVDDAGVHRAVEEGKLFYYVVDDPVDGPRAIHRDHPRIIATNHSGGITVESSARLDAKTFEQVTDAVHGRQPDHILNLEALDHPRVRAWLRQRRRESSVATTHASTGSLLCEQPQADVDDGVRHG